MKKDKDTSIASLLPYRSFSADGEVDFHHGSGLLAGYSLRGPSPESSTEATLAQTSAQVSAAFKHLGTGDTLHILFHRLPAPPPAQHTFPSVPAAMVHQELRDSFVAENHWVTLARAYLSHQYESVSRSKIKALVFSARQPDLDDQQQRAAACRMRWRAWENAAAEEYGLARLTDEQMFRDLILAVTGKHYPAILPDRNTRLSNAIAQEYFKGGTEPEIGQLHFRPLSLVAYPGYTIPQALTAVLMRPGRMLLCGRFIALDPTDAMTLLHDRRDWQAASGWERGIDFIMNVLNVKRKASVNQHLQARLTELDEAIATAANGMSFGYATITLVIIDTDAVQADMRAHQLLRDISALGMGARLEDVNAVHAIRSTWPANRTDNVRQPLIKASSFVNLMLPIERWPGMEFIQSDFFPANTPTPIVTSGTGAEPFHLPTHVNGVGHTLMFGPTGTGKSTALGALVSAYTGIPSARVRWLDLDYSSFVLSHLLNASYHDMGAEGATPLCPLAMMDHPGGEEWLHEWFMRLFRRWEDHDTGRGFELDSRQAEDFARTIRRAHRIGMRTLTDFQTLIDDNERNIKRIVRAYTSMTSVGRWGYIFDGEGETSLSDVTIFELRGLHALGQRAEGPATELILQSIINQLSGNHPTWITIDELWFMLGDKVMAEWLFDSLRVLRKKGAALVAATQSISEVAQSPFRDLLLDSCPNKIFLPSSELGSSYLRDSYYRLGLNDRELQIIGNARPGREYYYRSSQGRRLFSLELGPIGKAICGSTSDKHVQQARQILKDYPASEFTERWLGAYNIGLEPCLNRDQQPQLPPPSLKRREPYESSATPTLGTSQTDNM